MGTEIQYLWTINFYNPSKYKAFNNLQINLFSIDK